MKQKTIITICVLVVLLFGIGTYSVLASIKNDVSTANVKHYEATTVELTHGPTSFEIHTDEAPEPSGRQTQPTIESYFSAKELNILRKLANQTMDSFDPEKTGFQQVYLMGQATADDGTFFGATHLSSGELSTGSLEVGSEDEPSGITIFDAATNESFCIRVANGILNANLGDC